MKTFQASILGAAALAIAFSAQAQDDRAKAIAMMKRDFHAKGIATIDRLDEDGVQALCNHSDNNPPEADRRAPAAGPARVDQVSGRRQVPGRLEGGREDRAERPRHDLDRQRPDSPTAATATTATRSARRRLSFGTIGPSLLPVRQDPRQQPGDAEIRLRQDLQRQGLQPVLDNAALRPYRHADRDSRSRTWWRCCSTRTRRSTSRSASAREPPRIPAGAGRRRGRRPAPWRSIAGARCGAGRGAASTICRASATCICCTSPTATRSCCRSASASRTSTSASARPRGKPPHLVGEALLQALRHHARHARGARLHLPRLRAGRAAPTARSAASPISPRW